MAELRDFGPVDPTGATSSWLALQYAMNAVAAGVASGPIRLPAGTLLIDQQLTQPFIPFTPTPGATAPTTRTVTDAVVTSNAYVLTSASSQFLASDVGKPVVGAGIPAGTVITNYFNAGLVYMSANAFASSGSGGESVTLFGGQPTQRTIQITGAGGSSQLALGGTKLNMTSGYIGTPHVIMTNGLNSLAVASGYTFTTADIGRFLVGPGIPAGAVVTAVGGTTVFMSAPATQTLPGQDILLLSPKILALGLGTLSLEHLILMDNTNAPPATFAPGPFIQTTNAIILLNDVAFQGSGSPRTVKDATINGTTTLTSNSASFSAATDTGAPVFGYGIPAGTVINSVSSATQCTMSQPATATATNVTVDIVSCFQDAVVLGGTAQLADGTANGQFAGYGSVVEKCYFNYVRRAAFFRAACNNVSFRDNVIWQTCGAGIDAAAVDVDGPGILNLVTGNLVEVQHFAYAFRLNNAWLNTVVGNGPQDAVGPTPKKSYLLTAKSYANMVLICGQFDVYLEDDSGGTNAVMSTGSGGLLLGPNTAIENLKTYQSASVLGLQIPSGVTATAVGATGSTNYSYRVVAVDSNYNPTLASAAATVSNGNATLSAFNYNQISIPIVPGAAGYWICGRTAGAEQLMAQIAGTGATTIWNDVGTAVPSGPLPGNPAGNTLTIQMWTSQTAAPFQVLSSTGALRAQIDSLGTATIQYLVSQNAQLSPSGTTPFYNDAMLRLKGEAQNVTDPVLAVRAGAGNNSDLQRWESSGGTVLDKIDQFGNLTLIGAHLLSTQTSAPTAVAGANAGTSPPAPVVATGSTDIRGSLTCGTGTSPSAGALVVMTFNAAYAAAPIVTVAPTNAATAGLGAPYIATTASGFTISVPNAPAAMQPNTTYGFSYHVIG